MEHLALLGGIIALGNSYPLISGILKGRIKQSFATWFLWFVLDGITLASIYFQQGNIWLPLAYTIGSSLTTIALLYKKQFTWGKFETFICCLVVLCLLSWFWGGIKIASIASTAAVIIAGLPLLLDIIKKPQLGSPVIWIVFSLASILSFLGGKAWTLQERLYPAAVSVFCLLIVAASLRKPKVEPLPTD
jgi:hypothetical protein